MSTILERLQLIVDKKFERRASKFAIAMDISPNTLNAYLNPKKASKPTSDFLSTVVERTDVNALWLLTGKGNPFPEDTKTEIHTNSLNDIDGNNNKIGSDNNTANGDGSVVIDMPCPDDAQRIRELEREVENLKGDLVHKEDLIDQMKKTEESQNKRIAEFEERIAELKERIQELKVR